MIVSFLLGAADVAATRVDRLSTIIISGSRTLENVRDTAASPNVIDQQAITCQGDLPSLSICSRATRGIYDGIRLASLR